MPTWLKGLDWFRLGGLVWVGMVVLVEADGPTGLLVRLEQDDRWEEEVWF